MASIWSICFLSSFVIDPLFSMMTLNGIFFIAAAFLVFDRCVNLGKGF